MPKKRDLMDRSAVGNFRVDSKDAARAAMLGCGSCGDVVDVDVSSLVRASHWLLCRTIRLEML
jgi:hypothetical protein